jgi:hypothetical protein
MSETKSEHLSSGAGTNDAPRKSEGQPPIYWTRLFSPIITRLSSTFFQE